MDVQPVIEHLRRSLKGLRSVGGAAEFDAAVDGAVAPPCAFVLPLQETATPNGMLGVHEQRLTLAFGVVHVVMNRRDARGEAAMSELAPHRKALKAALLGWCPDPAQGLPVNFVSGRLLRLDNDHRLWWTDEFVFDSYERNGVCCGEDQTA